MCNQSKSSAFTLIELSIVLVIIGLIIGGILVGQDLIKGAEMRSIMDDFTRYETARQTFKLKYNCIPGDCDSASTFGLGNNGNGDKIIGSAPGADENWQFFSQLASAGFIEGSYSGDQGPGGGFDAVIGLNAPPAKTAGTGFSIYERASAYTTWEPIFGQEESLNTHFLTAGRDGASATLSLTFEGAFDETLTYSFDQKFDDGIASDGKIRTRRDLAGINVTCTTGPVGTYDYDLNSDGLCNIMYLFTP